jgi:uncharacterized protein YqeY
MIKDQIENDLKDAMRARNQNALDALRMLRTRIKNEEIAKGKDFGDPEVLDLVSSEVKRRRDSIESFTKGGRPELANKEQDEIVILQKYLPEQMSEEEVRKVVSETIAGQNLQASDFGKTMGMVMPKLKGRADGNLISKILKEILK